MKKRKLTSIIIYVAILALLFSWIFGLFGGGYDDIKYSQVVTLFEQGKVKSFEMKGERMYIELREPNEKGKTAQKKGNGNHRFPPFISAGL